VQKTSRLYDPERAVHILLIRCVRCGSIPDIAFVRFLGRLLMNPFLLTIQSQWSLGRVATPLVVLLSLATSGCMTYRVNSLADAPDANPGDRTCARAVPPGTETGAPGGLCTLRAAVMESNASVWKDTIEVPSGLYQLTLPVAAGGGHLAITDGVKIQGAGAATTIIDGNHANIVFFVQSEGLELNHVTVQGGNSQAGGGIRIDAGTSEFNNLVIRQNEAFTGGGGLLVDSGATLRMRRSAIIDNMATGAFGGGIWNKGELWVYDSTIANNDSNRAGGVRNEGQMNLRNVTVSGNLAHSPDAGTGGISQNGFAVLYNVTITNNTGVGNNAASFRGGGIQISSGKTTVLKNSIIAGNHGGIGPNDCVGQLSGDSKYNLIGDTNACTIPSFVSTFLLNVDPLLGPLANNGGPTQTHLPAANSPVLEAGYQFPPPAADGCEVRDQRGVPRPQGGGVCDMGAVEVTSTNAFVTGFTLVNAASNADIRPVLHGDTLVLSELPPELSIRAVVTGSPGSVIFDYDDTSSIQTENVAPYALAGDSPAGDYLPFGLSTGSHTLTATPFAAMEGGGAAGGSQTITFTVRNN
jgi:CSLREA domain-containing protein